MEESERQKQAIQIFLSKPARPASLCACMGKQPGFPDCPCAMRSIVEVDGYYYRLSQSKYATGGWVASNIGAVSEFRDGK